MADDAENIQPVNKVERLSLAGAVAPHLREGAAEAKKRRVTVYDHEVGPQEVVGYTNLAKFQEGILARSKIELAVEDGEGRPEKQICRGCGKWKSVNKRGAILEKCLDCRRPERVCEREGCGKMFRPRAYKVKQGKDRYCTSECGFISQTRGVERKCARDGCANRVKARPSQIKNGKGLFCSPSCRQCARGGSPPVKRNCEECGKEFMALASHVKIGRGRFHDRACKTKWQNRMKKRSRDS